MRSYNPFFEIWTCKSLSVKIWHPAENSKRAGPSVTKIERNHHIHGQKKIAFSYLDPGGTLEKNKQPKTLI